MSALKQALFDRYNRDRRRKTLPSHSVFCVDDRNERDIASDGSLYGYFCEIFVDVANEPIVEVRMSGNLPIGPEVKAWVPKANAVLTENPRRTLEFSVGPGEERKLIELAAAIEMIITRRYDTPSFKYVCPRTAKSLRLLAELLQSQNQT